MDAPFIVLEGLDGAGTTTQTERLALWLRERGWRTVETREPTNGPVGRVIRDVLASRLEAPALETLPWLFAADRADHLYRTVLPAIREGVAVVSDRYYPSSLAYQTLTLPYSRVRALNADFLVPDLTLFLDVDVDTCLRRIDARGRATEIFERREKMDAISDSYRRELESLRQEGDPIVTLDGTADVDSVTHAITAEVTTLLESWPAS